MFWFWDITTVCNRGVLARIPGTDTGSPAGHALDSCEMSLPPKVPDFEQCNRNAVMVDENQMFLGEKAQRSKNKGTCPGGVNVLQPASRTDWEES